MTDDQGDVQDGFLRHLCEKKVPATIFLMNGIKLQGIIAGSDRTAILLNRDGHVQLVFKHAVSTVMPSVPVTFDERAVPLG